MIVRQSKAGVRRGEDYNAMDAVREMEKFLLDHRGYQALYAVTQLSRTEFRRMFDCTTYGGKVRDDQGCLSPAPRRADP